MDIKIVKHRISVEELDKLAQESFIDMTKAVVDVEQKIMAVGGEWHADAEEVLLKAGSAQANLWGINIYPGRSPDAWIEFDSMVNLKPSLGNRSRNVENPEIREKIKKIAAKLILV